VRGRAERISRGGFAPGRREAGESEHRREQDEMDGWDLTVKQRASHVVPPLLLCRRVFWLTTGVGLVPGWSGSLPHSTPTAFFPRYPPWGVHPFRIHASLPVSLGGLRTPFSFTLDRMVRLSFMHMTAFAHYLWQEGYRGETRCTNAFMAERREGGSPAAPGAGEPATER
jgi:hypothetical protein